MKFLFTSKFKKLYQELPLNIRKKFDKQLGLLAKNIRHPSLQIKKIQGHPNVWEGRVDYHYRFTFNFENDMVTLRVIGQHDEALRNP